MSAKKKVPVSRKPLAHEKELRRLRVQNSRLEHLSGLLWVYRVADLNGFETIEQWRQIVALHDKHRNAVARGR